MSLFDDLVKFIQNKDDIINCMDTLHPHLSALFKECCNFVFENNECVKTSNEVDYILTYLHDLLNLGIWSEVPDCQKQAFTGVSFIKALILLKENLEPSKVDLRDILECIDRGFLLGLPLPFNRNLLTDSASRLCKEVEQNGIEDVSAAKCYKFDCNNEVYNNLPGKEIECIKLPPLEEFYKTYFLQHIPVVIEGCMQHWPACTKWLDINYILKIAGERTVPIEIGASYSDKDFSQKLMTLNDFVRTFYQNKSGDVGYLAQHDLLSQVPELKHDIRIPDYCCVSRNSEEVEDLSDPEINAWFGPSGTVSSLHFDPKDNLLCQVYGLKQVILYSPADSNHLYAFEDNLLKNTSQIDPINPDLQTFTDFKNAKMFKCLLKSGQMLYLPPKWWHHVTALEPTFSVNFWWQ